MSWTTDDGEHEGHVAPILDDGRQSRSSRSRELGDRTVAHFELVRDDDQPGPAREEISSDRVRWWVPQCTCGWRGTIWERVPERHLASDADHRAWVPLGELGHEPQHVEAAAHDEWKQHVEAHEALGPVRRAAEDLAQAQRTLEDAVGEARRQGLSWEQIGAGVGISRQAAHERWGRSDGGSGTSVRAEDLLGTTQVAQELGVSPMRVRQLPAAGQLPPPEKLSPRVSVWHRADVVAAKARRNGARVTPSSGLWSAPSRPLHQTVNRTVGIVSADRDEPAPVHVRIWVTASGDQRRSVVLLERPQQGADVLTYLEQLLRIVEPLLETSASKAVWFLRSNADTPDAEHLWCLLWEPDDVLARPAPRSYADTIIPQPVVYDLRPTSLEEVERITGVSIVGPDQNES